MTQYYDFIIPLIQITLCFIITQYCLHRRIPVWICLLYIYTNEILTASLGIYLTSLHPTIEAGLHYILYTSISFLFYKDSILKQFMALGIMNIFTSISAFFAIAFVTSITQSENIYYYPQNNIELLLFLFTNCGLFTALLIPSRNFFKKFKNNGKTPTVFCIIFSITYLASMFFTRYDILNRNDHQIIVALFIIISYTIMLLGYFIYLETIWLKSEYSYLKLNTRIQNNYYQSLHYQINNIEELQNYINSHSKNVRKIQKKYPIQELQFYVQALNRQYNNLIIQHYTFHNPLDLLITSYLEICRINQIIVLQKFEMIPPQTYPLLNESAIKRFVSTFNLCIDALSLVQSVSSKKLYIKGTVSGIQYILTLSYQISKYHPPKRFRNTHKMPPEYPQYHYIKLKLSQLDI